MPYSSYLRLIEDELNYFLKHYAAEDAIFAEANLTMQNAINALHKARVHYRSIEDSIPTKLAQ